MRNPKTEFIIELLLLIFIYSSIPHKIIGREFDNTTVIVAGKIIDSQNLEIIPEAKIMVAQTGIEEISDLVGDFYFTFEMPSFIDEAYFCFYKSGYLPVIIRKPINHGKENIIHFKTIALPKARDWESLEFNDAIQGTVLNSETSRVINNVLVRNTLNNKTGISSQHGQFEIKNIDSKSRRSLFLWFEHEDFFPKAIEIRFDSLKFVNELAKIQILMTPKNYKKYRLESEPNFSNFTIDNGLLSGQTPYTLTVGRVVQPGKHKIDLEKEFYYRNSAELDLADIPSQTIKFNLVDYSPQLQLVYLDSSTIQSNYQFKFRLLNDRSKLGKMKYFLGISKTSNAPKPDFILLKEKNYNYSNENLSIAFPDSKFTESFKYEKDYILGKIKITRKYLERIIGNEHLQNKSELFFHIWGLPEKSLNSDFIRPTLKTNAPKISYANINRVRMITEIDKFFYAGNTSKLNLNFIDRGEQEILTSLTDISISSRLLRKYFSNSMTSRYDIYTGFIFSKTASNYQPKVLKDYSNIFSFGIDLIIKYELLTKHATIGGFFDTAFRYFTFDCEGSERFWSMNRIGFSIGAFNLLSYDLYFCNDYYNTAIKENTSKYITYIGAGHAVKLLIWNIYIRYRTELLRSSYYDFNRNSISIGYKFWL